MARDRTKKGYGGKRRKPGFRILAGILAGIVITGLLIFALSPFVLYTVRIQSGAMSPAVSILDTVGVNHLAYLLLPPRRGDIVQFRTSQVENSSAENEDAAPIRRIVGLPGETVQISDKTVYINGYPLHEAYTSGDMTYSGTAASALTLDSNEYFVMADNRSNNFDSRDSTVGPVAGSDIIGKVWLRLKPFERFGLIS